MSTFCRNKVSVFSRLKYFPYGIQYQLIHQYRNTYMKEKFVEFQKNRADHKGSFIFCCCRGMWPWYVAGVCGRGIWPGYVRAFSRGMWPG